MTNHPIDFSDLSRHRGSLMGIAMLMVVLFHVGGMRHDDIWWCISRCGNIGVDMFLFLSGIGLWFAWTKKSKSAECRVKRYDYSYEKGTTAEQSPSVPTNNQSDKSNHTSALCTLTSDLKKYFLRRYLRIYPAWLIIACLYYIPRYADGRLSLTDTLLSITVNWGFWEHDELTFWFIPAIMMLYTVAPAYMELIRRRPVWRWLPVAAMLLCMLVRYWMPLYHAVGHLEIFFSRIPIFLLGVNAGLWVKERRTFEPSVLWLLLLLFAMSALVCINFEDGLRGRFPLFLERMAYIPLTVSMLLLLCRPLSAAPAWLCQSLTFFGSISLEVYLIHYQFILVNIRQWQLGYWLTAAVLIALSAVAAWLLHKAIDIITRPLHKALDQAPH